MTLAIGACGALLDYAAKTQGQALAHVTAVSAERAGEYVRLDAATRRNLELTETLRGEPAPTLFSLLDECATGMGSRLLRHWLHHPLRDRAALAARHDAVTALQDSQIHKILRRCSDVERITARLALKSVRPRELSGLRDSLKLLPELRRHCPTLPRFFEGARGGPGHAHRGAGDLKGHPCRAGRPRDRRRRDRRRLQRGAGRAAPAADDAGQFLVELEAREKQRTGIPNLRVAYNSVHGYYIEVTNSHTGKVPDDYRRRQTLKNAERYITPELKTFEDKALSARDRALALEKSLYEEVIERLQRISAAAAEDRARARQPDVLCGFAARRSRGTMPAAFHRPDLHRDRRRPPSGGRRPDRELHRQRLPPLAGAPLPADHRPEHGRQVDLHAAGGADRAAGAHRLVRAGARRAHRADRPDLHAHRRGRRPGRRALDLHGGDDRERLDPAQRHREEPGADGRGRPRHLDLRWPGARLGDRESPGAEERR